MALVEVAFPEGMQVHAKVKGHHIPTDQKPESGGEGNAPEPFDVFLASIATCAGYYAKSFCEQRGFESDEMSLSLDIQRNSEGIITRIDLVLRPGSDFPEKYDRAVARAMNLCAVKKQLREDIVTDIRIER